MRRRERPLASSSLGGNADDDDSAERKDGSAPCKTLSCAALLALGLWT